MARVEKLSKRFSFLECFFIFGGFSPAPALFAKPALLAPLNTSAHKNTAGEHPAVWNARFIP